MGEPPPPVLASPWGPLPLQPGQLPCPFPVLPRQEGLDALSRKGVWGSGARRLQRRLPAAVAYRGRSRLPNELTGGTFWAGRRGRAGSVLVKVMSALPQYSQKTFPSCVGFPGREPNLHVCA